MDDSSSVKVCGAARDPVPSSGLVYGSKTPQQLEGHLHFLARRISSLESF
jgi:hypothetical protein